MNSQTALSQLGKNAGTPAISDLMRLAFSRPELISLAAGFVDQNSLPVANTESAWRAIMADSQSAKAALQYGTTQGDPVLRYALAQMLADECPHLKYNPGALAEQLIITTGSQQLLYLIAEALVDPGDIVITEAPTYFVFLDLLAARGAEVIGVPIDEGGMSLGALEQCLSKLESEGRLSRVKLIYSVSEHSNPSGLSLAEDRRAPLVHLAKRFSTHHKIHILDDAAYRGLAFDGKEPASLWSHDRSSEFVIHARTFSKTFSPGIKIGYGVLPEALLQVVLGLKGHHDFGSSNLMQRLILQVLETGQYNGQVERLRAIYKEKAETAVRTMVETMGDLHPKVRWTIPKGGLYVWLTVPETIKTSRNGDFFAACLDEGVFYVPGEYCFPHQLEGAMRASHQMRICYGVPSKDKIREGIRRLARVVRRFID